MADRGRDCLRKRQGVSFQKQPQSSLLGSSISQNNTYWRVTRMRNWHRTISSITPWAESGCPFSNRVSTGLLLFSETTMTGKKKGNSSKGFSRSQEHVVYFESSAKLYHKLRTCHALQGTGDVQKATAGPRGYKACPLCSLEYNSNPAVLPMKKKRK